MASRSLFDRVSEAVFLAAFAAFIGVSVMMIAEFQAMRGGAVPSAPEPLQLSGWSVMDRPLLTPESIVEARHTGRAAYVVDGVRYIDEDVDPAFYAPDVVR